MTEASDVVVSEDLEQYKVPDVTASEDDNPERYNQNDDIKHEVDSPAIPEESLQKVTNDKIIFFNKNI